MTDSGLYYYRARYYSPMMAGFISEDPAGFSGKQLSFYAYVGGDPLDRIDPLGLWSFTISLYDGFGGALTIGQDNATGQWFYGVRVGVGLGGGWNIDPNGSRPGADQTSPCHGTTVGTFVEVTANGSIYGITPIEAEGGIDTNGDTYKQGPVPSQLTSSLGNPVNFSVGISAGVEVFGH